MTRSLDATYLVWREGFLEQPKQADAGFVLYLLTER